MADGLSVRGLSIAYDETQVLHDVSFTVAPGETFGLVGESGCGKSTLAYALGRHLAPGGRLLGGELSLDGVELLGLEARELRRWRASNLAFVHQDATGSLDPTMRVGGQLAEVLRDRGSSRAEAERESVELLGRVRFERPEQIARRYPHQLSGGQQQRVVIAAALAVRPRLLVLDEPTTGLDASVEHEILGLLARIRAELRAAVVFVSHDLSLIARMCDRVGVLYAGRLVEVGGVRPVLDAPGHPYTSALLSTVPRFGATRRERPLKAIPGRLPLAGETAGGCSFAPRCALAEDACIDGEPALDELAVPGRQVRCIHPGHSPLDAGVPTPPAPSSLLSPLTPPTPSDPEFPLLEVRGLTRSYGPTLAVDHVDLTIGRGEVFGLVGESGSGKTTLARAVAGLGPNGGGTIRLVGEPLAPRVSRRGAEARRRVQMVFQNPDAALNPSHTVRTLLSRAIRTLLGADPDADHTLEALLARTGIDADLLERRPAKLSGGQKQRVAIARGFAGAPALVVCDEPVSALDVSVQAGILELLAEQRDRTGTSYLFISHDLAVVGYLADRVAVMYRGAIVEEGAAADVMSGPSHPYTATLIDAASRPVETDIPTESQPSDLTSPTRPSVPHDNSGCRFADRCEHRIGGLCDVTTPPVRNPHPGHLVLCHLNVDALPSARPIPRSTHAPDN